MILLQTNNILLLRVYNLQSSLIFLFASVKSTGFTLFLFVGTFSGELFSEFENLRYCFIKKQDIPSRHLPAQS